MYFADKFTYIKMQDGQKEITFSYSAKNVYKRLYDRFDNAGTLDGHYFLQDIYVANKIINKQDFVHYDIGSRIDGFLSHLLASNVNVNMIDVRPLDHTISGLHFIKGDATDLRDIATESISSLSSLHAIEHFGLGRYGDKVDPDGWYKALKEMGRVLKKGGTLYLSVPIGNVNKVCFNAHRIFSPKTIVESLDELTLEEFVYIKDYKIIKNVDYIKYSENEDYLCGIFTFKK